jgi:hypothetical protein
MKVQRTFAGLFVLLVMAGTVRDRSSDPRQHAGVLVADLHVHPFPGDGALTVWQLQREASRRGLDVIAVAGHNNRFALTIGHALGLVSDVPMILESQELTSPDFHMIAVGVTRMIDWRHTVPDAVAAIHAQGAVAIAAHPVSFAWKPRDLESLRALDGVEVAHPMAERTGFSRRELDAFFAAARAAKPAVAPIGSTDFHGAAPLGLCRTYVLTPLASPTGVLEAIRQGRTVAQDQYGRLYGEPENLDKVRKYLVSEPSRREVATMDKLLALAALMCLVAATSWRRISP